MFITDFIDTLGAWLTGFWTLIMDTITQAIKIFWDTGFTVIGYLALFGLAVGLVYFGLTFVMRLIKK